MIKRLRTSGKRRWKRRLKKFQRDYRNGEKSLEEIKRSMASYRGHLRHGHTYRLSKKVLAGFVLTKGNRSEGDSYASAELSPGEAR
ncbi:MAG: hypothetical protein IJI57_08810 [Flexilinea sp.]|nr:hypothetical protein [Flexilinea sp.]